jgi:hypothetical protein
MHARIQIASICFAAAVVVLVFELVRRRKLSEKYALLWIVAGFALLLLAAWQGLLFEISNAVGIYYPPTTFLIIAFGFALLLLLNFSIASSRLAAETRVLAQRVALLEAELSLERQTLAESSTRTPSTSVRPSRTRPPTPTAAEERLV